MRTQPPFPHTRGTAHRLIRVSPRVFRLLVRSFVLYHNIY